MQRRILVTGASGYIGGFLSRYLAGDFEVIACARSRAAGGAFDDYIDFAAPASRRAKAPRAFDCLVHCAGLAHQRRFRAGKSARAAFLHHNTHAACNAFAYARANGAGRFIFLSSLSVYGLHDHLDVIDRDTPAHPTDYYGESKLLAEERLGDLANRYGVALRIVRPALVVGPNAPGNIRLLLSYLRTGLPFPAPDAANRKSYLDLTSLARLIQLLVSEPGDRHDVMQVAANQAPISTIELVQSVQASLTRSAGAIRLPAGAYRRMAQLAGAGRLYEKLFGSLVISPGCCSRPGWDNTLDLRGVFATLAREGQGGRDDG